MIAGERFARHVPRTHPAAAGSWTTVAAVGDVHRIEANHDARRERCHVRLHRKTRHIRLYHQSSGAEFAWHGRGKSKRRLSHASHVLSDR